MPAPRCFAVLRRHVYSADANARPSLPTALRRRVHSHFVALTGAQTQDLQGTMNASLPQIIESFGIASKP